MPPKRARMTATSKSLVEQKVYASFSNFNEHEGETWTYFVKHNKWDFEGDWGVDEVIETFRSWLARRDSSWNLEGYEYENDADCLVQHARDQGYMPSHMYADDKIEMARPSLVACMLDECDSDEPLWYKEEPQLFAPACKKEAALLIALFDGDLPEILRVRKLPCTNPDMQTHATTATATATVTVTAETSDASSDGKTVVETKGASSSSSSSTSSSSSSSSFSDAESCVSYTGCSCNELTEAWLAADLKLQLLRAVYSESAMWVCKSDCKTARRTERVRAAKKALCDWTTSRATFLTQSTQTTNAFEYGHATSIFKAVLLMDSMPEIAEAILETPPVASHIKMQDVWKEARTLLRDKYKMDEWSFLQLVLATADGAAVLAKEWLKFPCNTDTFFPTTLLSSRVLKAITEACPLMLEALPMLRPSASASGIADSADISEDSEDSEDDAVDEAHAAVGRWSTLWNAATLRYDLKTFVWKWNVFFAAGAFWKDFEPSAFGDRVLKLHKDDIAKDAASPAYRAVCMPHFFSTEGILDYAGCRFQSCGVALLEAKKEHGSARKAVTSWMLLVPTTSQTVDEWLAAFGKSPGALSKQVKAARIAGALLLS